MNSERILHEEGKEQADAASEGRGRYTGSDDPERPRTLDRAGAPHYDVVGRRATALLAPARGRRLGSAPDSPGVHRDLRTGGRPLRSGQTIPQGGAHQDWTAAPTQSHLLVRDG